MVPGPEDRPRSRRRRGFRLAALLVPVLLLASLELVLRLLGLGYPTHFFLKSRAQGREVWVENQKVAWRFFPPGLARSPQPVLLPAVKPADTCRIFIFGESAAMGDPEPAFGFGRVLEAMLRARYPGMQIEIVNVAVTAINSHVIREIARDCAPRQGDLWIIYMGNNEVVGPFGAGTVFGAQTPSLAFVRANVMIKSLRVAQMADDLWHRLKSGQPATWEGMEMFLRQQVPEDDPRMEAVYGHFQKNLEDILETASGSGVRVLLSTVASNLKDCPPFASLHRPDLTREQQTEWDKLYQSGIEAEKATNYEGALGSYLKAVEIDSRYAELQFRVGRCHWALGKYDQARTAFEHARDLDTLRFRADTRINQIIRKVAEARASDGFKSLDAVEVLARNSPHQVTGEEYLYEHVHLNLQGNYLIAQTLAAQIEASWPDLMGGSAIQGAPQLPIEECARRIACTDFDRHQILDEMVQRLAQPPFTQQLDHTLRTERLKQAQEALRPALTPEGLSQSINIYRQALALSPGDWRLHENFAHLLQYAGEPKGTEEQWRQVIELMPHYEQAYYSLGNVLDGEGKSAEAIRYFQMALRRRPDSYEAHNGLGLALASQGKRADAIQEYRAALRRKSDFNEARVNLGQALADQGQVEQALAEYALALRSNSNNVAAHVNLGKLLAAQKQLPAAIEHYQAALRVKPDNAVAHYNLANALASLGKADEAMQHFADAARYKPDFAEAHFNLGLELAQHGREHEALEHFNQAVRLKPGFVEAHLNLGVALAKERQFDAAIQQFQETLRLDPLNGSAKKFLDQAVALQRK